MTSPTDWATTTPVLVVMTPEQWALVAACLVHFAEQGEERCVPLFETIATAVSRTVGHD